MAPVRGQDNLSILSSWCRVVSRVKESARRLAFIFNSTFVFGIINGTQWLGVWVLWELVGVAYTRNDIDGKTNGEWK